MPFPFTGSPIWHATHTGPANGDPADGPSVTDMGVTLADNIQYLAAQVPINGNISIPIIVGRAETATWTYGPSQHSWDQNVLDQDDLWIELPNYPGSQLVSWSVYLLPASAHAALPATMPRIHLATVDITDGSPGFTANTSDTSGSVVAYETYHSIMQTLGSPVEFTNMRYIAVIEGEAGANALVGLAVLALAVNIEPVP